MLPLVGAESIWGRGGLQLRRPRAGGGGRRWRRRKYGQGARWAVGDGLYFRRYLTACPLERSVGKDGSGKRRKPAAGGRWSGEADADADGSLCGLVEILCCVEAVVRGMSCDAS